MRARVVSVCACVYIDFQFHTVAEADGGTLTETAAIQRRYTCAHRAVSLLITITTFLVNGGPFAYSSIFVLSKPRFRVRIVLVTTLAVCNAR